MTSAVAYEHCRRIARASGSSFYTGMRLLPPDRRAALFAVYALARRIDDIADGDLSDAEKLAALERMRADLARIGESVEPVLVAVAHAAVRFPIPLEAFGDLIDGAEMDARGEYETFADLERYCRCVAGLDRPAGARRLRLLGPRARRRARRRPRCRAADRERASRRRRGRGGRPRLPASRRPRALRGVVDGGSKGAVDEGRRKGKKRRGRAADRLRGAARARVARPRPRPRAAARPPQRVGGARDGRASTACCSSGSRPSPRSCCRDGCRCAAGRRDSSSPAALPGSARESVRRRRRAGRGSRPQSSSRTRARK